MSMHVTPINKFHEAINPTVLNVLMDDSYSMTPMRTQGIVSGAINEVMIPALQGAHKHRKDVLRLALGAFSDSKIQSLTKIPGYFTLEQLRRQPISNDQFGVDGLNGMTALFASMVDGINSCLTAARIVRDQLNCRSVKAQLVVMTDGDNQTHNPTTPADVHRTIINADPFVELHVHLAYFKTNVGIDRAKFMQIAKSCGVTKCHFWADHGDSLQQQQKAFREFAMIPSKI